MGKIQELVPFGWPENMAMWQSNNCVKYSLDTKAWGVLYDRQGGKCAGCLEVLADPRVRNGKMGLKPQVDHRHAPGEPKVGRRCEVTAVRGLLCQSCNMLLGKVQDDKALLERLVNYLKQHGDY